MKRLVLALALGLIGGCEQGEPAKGVKSITVVNPHSDRLKALSPDLRLLGLMRAIRDNGRRCKRVVSGDYQQQHSAMAMWVAMCEDGRYWGIFIAPNADVQVRDCKDMGTLNLPQCRPPAGSPSVPEPGKSR
jgi:hypothetical protein